MKFKDIDVLPRRDVAALIFTGLLLLAGLAVRWLVDAHTAFIVWTCGAVAMGLPLVVRTAIGAFRGHFATDIVATLSIVAGILLAQPIVSLIVILMLRGGEMLERYAEGRASNAVRALESAAPRSAHRVGANDVTDVPVDAVMPNDLLLIRPGDIVPCDGVVTAGASDLDTSSLTGEAAPVRTVPGLQVSSGTRNGVGSFQMRVLRPAAQSQYAQIVEMVRAAQADKAPLQRLADKYAVWFTPFTLLLCAATYLLSRNWLHVLAILAVATPCPLILATPIAIIGGINRAAQRLIIIKSGGALERLSDIAVVAFDKTGTLTFGNPQVRDIRTLPGFSREELLGYAASVEAHSSHHLARVIVAAAREGGVTIEESDAHVETPGAGMTGVVAGRRVHVGSRGYVSTQNQDAGQSLAALGSLNAAMTAYVAIDGQPAGAFEFDDASRPEAPRVIHALREQGLTVRMLSGDDSPTVRALADLLGIQEQFGDLKPADKAQLIEQWRANGAGVMMIGDGINDAIALSVADVGVAIAATGSNISSEAADIVILTGGLQHIPEMLQIGKRTKRIAVQSIRIGLGLSAVGMGLAAVGLLTPVAGAVMQELIDVAVILNALRTAASPRT